MYPEHVPGLRCQRASWRLRELLSFPWWAWGSWALWLVLFLAPQSSKFPYPSRAGWSDIAIAHLPQILYLRRALAVWHTLPLWAPTYYSGYPLYADPLSNLWYAPGWLGVLLPLPWGLTLTVGLHWLVSALGMAAFLRALGRSKQAAFLGALAWIGFSKIWAHWGAGHLTLVYASAWLPWLMLSACRRGRWLRPGVVLALIFLADPRMAAYAALLWTTWEAVAWGKAAKSKKWRVLANDVLSWGSEAALALLLAAPLWLPLLHYAGLSTRAHMTVKDILLESLPMIGLLGEIVPFVGVSEWVFYVGAATAMLAIAAWVRGKARFWGGVALAALVWALGKNLPGASLLAHLPGLRLLRVPPRGLFVLGFAFAVAAAFGWDVLASPWPSKVLRRRNVWWFTAGITGIALTVIFGLSVRPTPTSLLAHGVAVWILALVLALAWKRQPDLWLWALFLGVDLLLVAWQTVSPRSPTRVFAVSPVLESAVASVPKPFRIYTPSYSVPQQVAAAHNWELANGVDPLALNSYARFMTKASGVPWNGYDVVLPPLPKSNIFANRNAHPDARLLGLLNVRLVVAAYPVRAEGLQLMAHQHGLWIYRNTFARPRAWVETGSGWKPATRFKWAPDQVGASAAGPGMLVFSEIAYPGWQAWMDGQRVPLQTAHDVLRAVALPSGNHEVVLRFRPWDLAVGWLLGALGAAMWLMGWRRRAA